MAESKQYFRVITTTGPGDPVALGIEHDQKLNNYLKYDYPATNGQLMKDMPKILPVAFKREVESQSTGTTVRNNWFTITTTLCCEDSYEEKTGV